MIAITHNVIRLAEVAKKQALIFDFAKTLQTQKNFKLNLNLQFLQTCVSISAVLKTEFYEYRAKLSSRWNRHNYRKN